jgi:hypothetical protein
VKENQQYRRDRGNQSRMSDEPDYYVVHKKSFRLDVYTPP